MTGARVKQQPSDTNTPPWWRAAWPRRDVRWMLGLCVPPLLYGLSLKLVRGMERTYVHGPALVTWVGSDVLAQLSWLGLAAAVSTSLHESRFRTPLRVLLQLAVLLHTAVLLGAHGYFGSTGASLDYPTIAFALEHLQESRKVIASASSPFRWAGFVATIIAVVVLPWLLARGRDEAPRPRVSDRWLGSLLGLSVSLASFSFALTVPFQSGDDLARDPLLQLIATARERLDDADDPAILARAQAHPRGPRKLIPHSHDKRKNLVVILLESTSAWSTSLYGGKYATTPFLAELAQNGLVAERAYAVVPHTSKAVAATLCGLEPRPGVEMAEALEGGMFGKCLATLLGEQGYRTAMLQAASSEFEARPQLIRNLGFSELIAGEDMPSAGFAVANYFGREDRVMLEPTRNWLTRHAKEGPFFLAYLTNTPHHDYLAPKSYGFESFSPNKMLNRYLNTVRYDDFFLRDLFAEFERQGLLESTVFVILGDHGDAFGEHGLYVHDDIMYDECLRIPLVIYDGAKGIPARRLPGPFTQLDVAPTALDLLGFELAGGSYSGRSMLAPAEKRPLYFGCLTDNKCLARIEDGKKLIHSFDRKPDELYDLASDPTEKHNLAREHPGEVKRARADALAWYRTIRAMYRPALERADSPFITAERPNIAHPRSIKFGSAIEYLGWSMDHEPITAGDWITITTYYRVLEPLPEGAKLFMFAEDASRTYGWNHVPVHRMYPEARWRAGQYLADPFRVKVSSRWQRSTVVVRGGFEQKRGARLDSEPADPTDAPILAEIPIRGRSASKNGPSAHAQ